MPAQVGAAVLRRGLRGVLVFRCAAWVQTLLAAGCAFVTPIGETAAGASPVAPPAAPRVVNGTFYSGATDGVLRIVVDPGHGGQDLGAQGYNGVLEKDVVLDVAQELERRLRQRLSAEVLLTRRGDQEISLAERTQQANRLNADLFVSLHVNGAPNRRARGFEVYYLDNTDDRASMKLAERENQSMGLSETPGDLEFLISDLIQGGKAADSIELAHLVAEGMARYLRSRWPRVRNLGVKRAPFFVLVGAHMPCVLVEMFFITNPEEEQWLGRPDFRRDLAEAIYKGIERYMARSAEPTKRSRAGGG